MSRLVKRGQLRRVGRDLYDWPQTSRVLRQVVPPDLDQAVAAIARRDGMCVMSAGLGDANGLGLTNAMLGRALYLTDRPSRSIKVWNSIIEFKHASSKVMQWHGRPGCPVVNALFWFGRRTATAPENRIIQKLRRLPDHVKKDLMEGIALLPAWMADIVNTSCRPG